MQNFAFTVFCVYGAFQHFVALVLSSTSIKVDNHDSGKVWKEDHLSSFSFYEDFELV